MEHAAYWALVQQHLPALNEHARKMAYYVLRNSRPGSLYTADDLLHDTLLKVQKSTTSRAEQPEPDWFIKVCKVAMRHLAYDLLATVDSKRTRTIAGEVGTSSPNHQSAFMPTSNADEEALGNRTSRYSRMMTDPCLSPLEVLEQQDQEHALQEALYALGRKHPETALVLLYSLEVPVSTSCDDNHECKARELGISGANYRQHRHQGIKRLRATLNP